MRALYQKLFILVISLILISQFGWAQRSVPSMAPAITVSPTSFSYILPVGSGTVADVLSIGNAGTDDLLWNLQEGQPVLHLNNGRVLPVRLQQQGRVRGANWVAPPSSYLAEIPKGAEDTRVGPAVLEGLGGPDDFGYQFIDSDEPGGPAFVWQDITTSGTQVFLNDDDFIEVSLPFAFPFYGVEKNAVKISSNGYLTFGPDGEEALNLPIPVPAVPNDIICPFWDDLNPVLPNGRIHYYYDSTAPAFIVQYTNVKPFGGLGGTAQYTFQAVLKPDGEILFYYLDMRDILNRATVGIENAGGNDGLQIAFNTNYIHNNLAISISPGATWITADPISGTVTPGATQPVNLEIDISTLTPGLYEASLLVNSNDPAQPQVVIPVVLDVGPPDITVTPPSVDFGTVLVGSSGSATVTVGNQGAQDLSVSVTSLGGANPGSFAISSGAAPFIVPPGTTHDVVIDFTPLTPASFSASLSIESNDPDGSPVEVALSGIAVEPDIAVSPTTHNFGLMQLGNSASQSFTISNEGTGALNVSALDLTGSAAAEFSITSGAPGSIPPGGNMAVEVTFTPLTLGAKSAALEISSDDPDENPVVVPLSATVVPGNDPADIAVSPLSVDFGNVIPGSSAGATVTVANEGQQELFVYSSALGGANPSEFAIVSGAAPFSVLPGTSHEIALSFNPTLPAGFSASLVIQSNDPDENPVVVALNGTGFAPEIAVSPSGHDYGDVQLGSSASQSFTVSNEGTEMLDVTALDLTGSDAADFSVTTGAPGSIPPGGSLTVEVTFAPQSLGAKTAALEIASNDPDENPLTVNLSGNAVPVPVQDITVEPASYNFGDVTLGATASFTFTVRNDGTADLLLSTVELLDPAAAGFAMFLPDTLPQLLAPGGVFTVDVDLTPAALGALSATLRFGSDDPDENPLDVPLSGNGMPVPLPDIAADPPSFDYGVVTIGYIASQAVMVSNQGTADLVINDVQLVNSNCLNFYRLDAPFGNPVSLAPGAQMEVMVRFEPKDTIPEPATVDLRISSNDPDEGQLLVPLSGSGTVNLTPPDISVQPLSYDFGMVMPGDTVYKDFRILNEGVGELLVHNMILIDDDMDEFAIVNTGLRFTVAPGDTHWGTIRYAPYDESRDRAFWVIKSNDPDERKVYVRVKGHYCPPCTTGFSGPQISAIQSQVYNRENFAGLLAGLQDPAAAISMTAPVVSEVNVIRSLTVREGEVLNLQIAAQGTQGAAAQITINNLPAFAQVLPQEDGTVAVHFLPEYQHAGYYELEVILKDQDAAGQSRTRIIPLVVENNPDEAALSSLAAPAPASLVTTLPEKFNLEQNYPNPFNPSTHIRFAVAAEQAMVSLKIYDITGKLVKTLANEVMPGGYYTVEWDGTNDHAASVAAGIYFYRLNAGEFVQTRKMIYLK